MNHLEDKDLGIIKLKSSSRAKNITARIKNGTIQITYPYFLNLSDIEDAFLKLKPKLLILKQKSPAVSIITPQFSFKTFSFTLQIRENNCSNYYMHLHEGVLSITFPQATVYETPHLQTTIRNLIEKAMKFEAKRLFPEKVNYFATKLNFSYSQVKINKSRTRWGSCSSKKSINLSYYCMFLPEYLIDFVILHELCHTVEMNHGDRFWNLLDIVSDGKAKILTSELKAFKQPW